MAKLLVLIGLVGCGLISLRKPYIGIAAAFLLILLQPDAIWPWAFIGLRTFFLVAVPALIGALFALASGNARAENAATRYTLLLGIWWLFGTVSYVFGPYVDSLSHWRFFNPDVVYEQMCKTLLFYLAAAACIQTGRAFAWVVGAVVVACAYLVYWANDFYLSGYLFGRLRGPNSYLSTHYNDENVFAAFFVMGLPFVYYLGFMFRRFWMRAAVWCIVPLGWHAVFLTGSRGSLLGLLVSLAIISWRSRVRFYGLLAIPLFYGAYVWQGGPVMKDRAKTIGAYEEQSSAVTRMQAWGAALNMMKSHPVFGVGLSGFGPAFSDHSIHRPRAAHNTVLEVGAESGIIAGLAWGSLLVTIVVTTWRRTSRDPPPFGAREERFVWCVSQALIASAAGFGVCSLFLSLQGSEIPMYLAIIANFILLRGLRAGDPASRKSERAEPDAGAMIPSR